METIEFFCESEAELLKDIPCFDPFSPESARDIRDLKAYYGSDLVWCDLDDVERYLAR